MKKIQTKITLILAFLLISSLASFKALGVTGNQLEANVRAATPGCPDFTIAAPSSGGPVVDGSSYVSPSNTGAQNYTGFANAISYCKSVGASKLTIPTGTYYIGNYTSGPYGNGNIYFNDLTNFIFDGQGSTFLIENKSTFIAVHNVSHFVLQNFTMGWNWSLTNVQSLTQIQDIGTNATGTYIDLYYPYETNPAVNSQIPSDFVEVDGVNFNFAHQGMGVVGVANINLNNRTLISPGVIRYYSNSSNYWVKHGAAVGQYYLIRHFEYDDANGSDSPGFETEDSDNLVYSNLTVYSTLGMGFLFQDNQYYEVINSSLIREPGTLYHLSGSSDGIHVDNSYGYFKIIGVEIGNTGDDSINIHDTISQGVRVTGANTLVASNAISWRNPYHVNDPIELRKGDLSPWNWTGTVTSSTFNSDDTCSLAFSSNLPAGLTSDSVLFDHAYNSANYIIANCYIHDNKVRGMIVHNGNGTIENNQVIDNYCPGLFLVCLATTYQEGFNPTNVLIQNNVFDGNDILRDSFSSMPENVVIAGQTTSDGIVDYPICQNIVFEYNLVANCPYAGLEIASATNVVVDNNTFTSPNQFNDLSSVLGSIMMLDCGGVVFSNNDLILESGVTSYKTNISVNSSTATQNMFVGPFVPNTLPSPWVSYDIGNVGLGGYASYTNGIYTVAGSGVDIWGTSDSYQMVYQPWVGDGQIVARVTGITNTASAAKAGLMFRETLDPASAQGDLSVTPTSGVSMQGRTAAGLLTSNVLTLPGITVPCWLALVRQGNTLYGYESPDGVNWTPAGTNYYSMTNTIYVGLCVTSKSNSVYNVSTFDHVSVGGFWQNLNLGNSAGTSLINYSNGVYSVGGSGSDIWGSSDDCQYLYQGAVGDEQIVARVTGVQATNAWAKAAVMIRETLATNARNTTLFFTPSNWVSLQGRTNTAGPSYTVNTVPNLVSPQWIKLVRSSENMNGYYSADGINWKWIGTQTNLMSTTYDIGLAVTSKTTLQTNNSTFDNVSVSSAWDAGDIGNVGTPGSSAVNDTTGTFVISGSGADIWGTSDAFQYSYQPLYGDGQIVVRVDSVSPNLPGYNKAGVMIRNTLDPAAVNALLYISATNGVAFQVRTNATQLTGNIQSASGSVPYWLMLSRSGSTFTASESSDGHTWASVGSTTLTMGTNVWIGLAVSSKDNQVLNTATFDSVTITPLP
ncbi:MAG TPA: right-handed parallel beta-helix repeat-containing protein [Verrucomicrobiae bacterium]